MTIRTVDLDFANADQVAQVLRILSVYAMEDGGGNRQISQEIQTRLPQRLNDFPGREVLVALDGDESIGVAICFTGFSTFNAMPILNLHDLAVLPQHRGKGAGSALLQAVTARARERGCCKVTLEVIATNDGAQRLYQRHDFHAPNAGSTYFMEKPLLPADE